MVKRYDPIAHYVGMGEYVGQVEEAADGDYVRVGDLAELVMRMRDWLAASTVSERITAQRCRQFLAICDEYSGNS